jgi:hypothetical protein
MLQLVHSREYTAAMPKKGDKQRFCNRGHDTDLCGRNPANRSCRRCQADDQMARQNADPAGTKSKYKDWYDRRYNQIKDGKNKTRRAHYANLSQLERDALLAKERARWHSQRYAKSIEKQFGIPFEQYERMFVEQNGCCAICSLPQALNIVRGKNVRLALDHDHETGEVRALLCGKCNLALGNMDDSIGRLFAAISYLRKYQRIEEVG